LDVDRDLRGAKPDERKKYHRVVGVVREHDCDALTGPDTQRRKTSRQATHLLAEISEGDDGPVEEAERFCRIVAHAAF
jgi:hypothetical protein